jgi:hypothetical protein
MMATRPTFLKQSRVIAGAPGLFGSPATRASRNPLSIHYKYNDELRFRFVGPQQLGCAELGVQQALMALAGQQIGWMRKPMADTPAYDRILAMLGQRPSLTTSYNELAQAANYQPNSGGCDIVRSAFEVLCAVSVFIGRPEAPISEDVEMGSLFRSGNGPTARGKGSTLSIELCPLLAAAVLGGDGDYVRVSLVEAHKLESKAARLVHHRLHWINKGQKGDVGLAKLAGYVYPEAASSDTQRKRHQRVRAAVMELRQIGWTVKEVGDIYTVGRPDDRPSGSVPLSLPGRSRPSSRAVTPAF